MADKKLNQKDTQSKQELLKKSAQYSGLAIQILVVIVGGAYLGKWLDNYFGNTKPILTLITSLTSIVAALYYLIKKVRQ